MNNLNLFEYLQQMDDENLKTCFEEYEELNRTGVLKQGKARDIERWYKKRYGIGVNDGDVLRVCQKAVYYEMAIRWYDLQ